jgi:beta-galactosidase
VKKNIVTAGTPAQIQLTVDRNEIIADGNDVAHVTVQILDTQANLAPTADNPVSLSVEGPGRILGVDNGNPVSHEAFQSNQRKAFNGLCLAIIQSSTTAGAFQITSKSPGLSEGSVTISTINKEK